MRTPALLLGAVALAAAFAVVCGFSDQHSLRPPYAVPFWTLGGDTQNKESFVRLVEDRQSKTGYMWSYLPFSANEWEVVFDFRIHGVSALGADGLGFWYTAEHKQVGPLFGNQEMFNGLGVVIDTFDNDGSGQHPYIMAVINDGTKRYKPPKDHHDSNKDHSSPTNVNALSGVEVGGCQAFVRNKETLSSIKVTYTGNNRLTVRVDEDGKGEWKVCVDVVGVRLPRGNYFGFTAATGELADNHDLYSFTVSNLDSDAQHTPVQDGVAGALSGMQYEISLYNYQVQEQLRRVGKIESDMEAVRFGLTEVVSNMLTSNGARPAASMDGGARSNSNSGPVACTPDPHVQADMSEMRTQLAHALDGMSRLSGDVKSLMSTQQSLHRLVYDKVNSPVPVDSGSSHLFGWFTFVLVILVGVYAWWGQHQSRRKVL